MHFYLDSGGDNSYQQAMINYGASSYDRSILTRILLDGGITTILDTYVEYFPFYRLQDPDNPILTETSRY